MRILSLLILVAFVGCDRNTAPPTPSMTGTWTGNMQNGTSFTMTTTERDEVVTGSGSVRSGAQALAFTVTGTHVHPNVSLTVRITGYQDANFTGAFRKEHHVRGTLNGSGFVGEEVEFVRQ